MNIAPECLTVSKAAAKLGVSEKTIRRRIRAGILPAELVEGPYGKQYQVPAEALATVHEVVAILKKEPRTFVLSVVQAFKERDDALIEKLANLEQQTSNSSLYAIDLGRLIEHNRRQAEEIIQLKAELEAIRQSPVKYLLWLVEQVVRLRAAYRRLRAAYRRLHGWVYSLQRQQGEPQ